MSARSLCQVMLDKMVCCFACAAVTALKLALRAESQWATECAQTSVPHLHDLYFTALEVFSSLQCNELNQLCRGMFDGTILGCFSFVKPYHKLQGIELLQDLFNSHAVQRMLQVCPQYRQTVTDINPLQSVTQTAFCFLYLA